MGARHGEERTQNMRCMSVTLLEVSKLSGWLKACAYCRVERRACGAGQVCAVRGQQAADDRGVSSVQKGPDCRLGAGHGEERTWNMRNMLVTLEVSKLSDWLSANAYCRESKGGHIRCGATTADF